MTCGPVGQKEMSFKGKVYGGTDDGQKDDGPTRDRRTTDGQRPNTIAHIEHSARVS